MFYKSPDRAITGFTGHNTGPLRKKWSIIKNNGRQILTRSLEFCFFLFDI